MEPLVGHAGDHVGGSLVVKYDFTNLIITENIFCILKAQLSWLGGVSKKEEKKEEEEEEKSTIRQSSEQLMLPLVYAEG